MAHSKHKIIRNIGVALGITMVLAGCSSGDQTAASDEDATLRVNFSGFPENWTPGAEMEGGLLRVPYETLLSPPTEGSTPEPALATDYELTEDALTLTLRDDVTFHDGEPFNAEAVKVNIEAVQDGATVYSGKFSAISSVEVIDDYTVKLNFDHPTPSMPTTLTTRALPIASPKAIEDGSVAQHPVGTSPWAYDEGASVANTQMHFSAFEDYWGEMPGFQNIQLHQIADPESSAAAIMNNELDITRTEQTVVSRFDDTDIETLSYPSVRQSLLFFDRGSDGIFESQDLRQAVCSAIDMEEMSDVVEKIQPATQYFSETEPGYSENIDGYPADLNEAQELYEAAGSPSISFDMPAAPFNEQQIRIYMDQIAKIDGLSPTVDTMPPPQFSSKWSSGSYPLGLASNDEMTPYDWYEAWFAADAPGNISGEESDELKAAAQAAIEAGMSEEADQLWSEVVEIVSDEALACAHSLSVETIAYNPNQVSGVDEPHEPWEPQSVNYRDLVPAS